MIFYSFFSGCLPVKLLNHVNTCSYILNYFAFNVFQYLIIVLRHLCYYQNPSLSAPNPTVHLLNCIVLILEEEGFGLFWLFLLLQSL